MNLVADESVDGPIVYRLRQEGHDVDYVAEMEPGISDDAVLSFANQAGSILLTADKDFGELVYRLRRVTPGIILLRLAGLSPNQKAELIVNVIRERAQEFPHAFTVITPKSVRIRHP